MTDVAERILTGLLTLGVGAWIGGFATVLVLSRSSRRTLDPVDRVAYFRDFGRRYAVVAAVVILFVVVPSAVLVTAAGSSALTVTMLAVALALIAVTIVGILQARRMTQLRRTAIATPGDAALAAAVTRGAGFAIVLRTIIGLGSLALFALAIALALPGC